MRRHIVHLFGVHLSGKEKTVLKLLHAALCMARSSSYPLEHCALALGRKLLENNIHVLAWLTPCSIEVKDHLD